MNKPHCYGEMDWILKYPEDEIPKTSICSCEYTNSCLQLTNNKRQETEVGGTWMKKGACLFCAGEKCIIDEPHTVVYVTENELRNHTQTPDGEQIRIDYKIDYCPKCGRKLTT